MDIQNIIDAVQTAFQIEINDIELENSRFEILREFCCKFLMDFNIDVDSVAKVQLCQDISWDGELVPVINFMSCINTILPNYKIGIFDIISPTKGAMLEFFKSALIYHNFCDEIVTHIYDVRSPFVNLRNAQKQISDDISHLNNSTNDLMVKIDQEKAKMTEESQDDVERVIQQIDDLKHEKRAEEIKLLDLKNKKMILMRKKQQLIASLNEKKRLLEFKSNKLNHSFNSGEQVEALKNDKLELKNKMDGITLQTDEAKRSQVDFTKIKQILEERCRTVDQIHQSIENVNSLEEAQKEQVQKEKVALNELKMIENNISQVKDQNKIALLSNESEIEELRKILNKIRKPAAVNLSRLKDIGGEHKDLAPLKNELKELDVKESNKKKLFIKEENKLKAMERELVKDWMEKFARYKRQLL